MATTTAIAATAPAITADRHPTYPTPLHPTTTPPTDTHAAESMATDHRQPNAHLPDPTRAGFAHQRKSVPTFFENVGADP